MQAAKAVIFDMDGVLIDSYHAHFESWRIVAAEEGIDFSRDVFDRTFGRTSREIIQDVWGHRAATPERVASLDARKEAAYREIISRDFPAMPAVGELIDALASAGFKLAIGSSGPPENVALVLSRLQRERLFSAVVSGADVVRGKPDPAIFLLAAQRMGAAPERCAVIEDAPLGIAAARAAGMAAIGLASTGRRREQLAAADAVFDSLFEITPEIIERILSATAARTDC
mgnify:CR=1 FL=1